MTKTNKKRDDDKDFVVLCISRNDVREMCGDAQANSLSDEDMQTLAEKMSEYCFDDNFIEALEEEVGYMV